MSELATAAMNAAGGTLLRRLSAASLAVSTFVWLPIAAPCSADEPEVVLVGFEVTPASPGPETLCRLVATIDNKGSQAVYSFGFDVELNGRALPVYERQLFFQVVESRESADVALYNFWTSEHGRSAPADGKLEVVVRLREARWVEVTEIKENGETVEVWTPVGAVAGLPQTVRRMLVLK